MSYIGDYFRNFGVGLGVNRTKIEQDGTIQMEGSATVWEDVIGSLIGRTLSAVLGTVDYNWGENSISFSDDGDIDTENDCVVFNFQYPHGAKAGGTMNLHIHWEQTDSTDREFTTKYRIQGNGVAKTTTWTTVAKGTNANNVFEYTSGTLNQITKITDIYMTGAGISSTVQFKFTRSDSAGGVILGTFIDAHVEMDTIGSRTEFSK